MAIVYGGECGWFSMLPGSVFCLLLRVTSGCARPITGQVTSVTWPMIGWTELELTQSKRQITGPGSSYRCISHSFCFVGPGLIIWLPPSIRHIIFAYARKFATRVPNGSWKYSFWSNFSLFFRLRRVYNQSCGWHRSINGTCDTIMKLFDYGDLSYVLSFTILVSGSAD